MSNADDLQKIQLTKSYAIHQRRRGHRTATDDVLCAWAGSRARPNALRFLDIGAGHGSVTLMVAGRLSARAVIDAVEVQPVSHELLLKNIIDNGLADRVTAHCGDLRDAGVLDDHARYDLITGSPPFMPVGSGVLPKDAQRAGGRFELKGGVEGYMDAAKRWLAPDGVASILMDGASRKRSLAAIAASELSLRHEIVVFPRAAAAPRYRIYQCVTSGAAAPPTTETLTVRDDEGHWTTGFLQVRAWLDLP